MNGTQSAMQLIPARFLDARSRALIERAEELRLRIGQPVAVQLDGRELPLPGEPITQADLMHTLEKATGASFHTAAPALSRGFVSYRGLRIGVCGTVAEYDGRLQGFRCVTSLSVRIPKECFGVCDGVLRQMQAAGWQNLLILSPPGLGKTTALRELIRKLSCSGYRVGVTDERYEIAAAEEGRPGFSLGPHCDVISGVPKAKGAMMLLRAMNPQILAMDEITQPEDLFAIREIVGCGVRLLATAHASGPEDLRRRPIYRAMAEEGLFGDLLVIRRDDQGRKYEYRRGVL